MYREAIRQTLEQADIQQRRRQLQQVDRGRLDFCSNDYLGLSQDTEVLAAYQQGLKQWGCGATASPLVRGYSTAHHALAEYLADWLDMERVLLFNSGFAANSGVLQALQTVNLYPVLDRLAHASLYDAVQAGRSSRFRHNDYAHLQSLLAQQAEATVVVTESVFSMDGDGVSLAEITPITKRFGSVLLVDDAHGFGILGDGGRGVRDDVHGQHIDILTATFGKACGIGGAFIGASADVANLCLQRCSHFIYSTAFSAAQAVAILAAIERFRSTPELRLQLQKNVSEYQRMLRDAGLTPCTHNHPIQPLIVGQNDHALRLAVALQQQGIDCIAIRPPTVPQGTARLRVSIRANHSSSDLDRFISCLVNCLHNDRELADVMYRQ
ncbi:MAG: 8-amino-7-oxononanoate synthase [Aliidiomarina sp.]|uniref:aminotransferase class I/II-fold pyridoxal phosphate-dependent enzyme n=1 Tax=Aliidiomarina sp. TaxID=1872439 RepID=UPI0025BFF789|nr:8-amino-7-oxononanoate synthase [Aliidiomarina sp.]MCH8500303.1 8-amino-7-oxononanoate synthase [Aliidiomarina sp.]